MRAGVHEWQVLEAIGACLKLTAGGWHQVFVWAELLVGTVGPVVWGGGTGRQTSVWGPFNTFACE